MWYVQWNLENIRRQPNAWDSHIAGFGEDVMHVALSLYCRKAIFRVSTQLQGNKPSWIKYNILGKKKKKKNVVYYYLEFDINI